MRSVDLITQILLAVVGLKWLLVELFQFDLVAAIFSRLAAAFARVVYVVVSLSADYQALRIPVRMDKCRPALRLRAHLIRPERRSHYDCYPRAAGDPSRAVEDLCAVTARASFCKETPTNARLPAKDFRFA